jgi:RNA polymerase sigma-70 factor (ECF subfamily)
MVHMKSLASPWQRTSPERSLGSEFEEFVEQAVASAEQEHPGVGLEAEDFVTYVAERISDPIELRTAHWGDLYLACACAMGNAVAIQRMNMLFLSEVPRYVARVSRSPAFAAEIHQKLSVRLLTGDDGSARILEYSGRGSLAAWMRIAAVRLGLNALKAQSRSAARERVWSDAELLAPQRSPELELLRQRSASDVRAALEETIAELDRDARNVLRMHYLDGLSGEDIAASYGVHRATVSRWIKQAEETILSETRRRLRMRLSLQPQELDSLIAFVQTSLNVCLRGLLGDPHD